MKNWKFLGGAVLGLLAAVALVAVSDSKVGAADSGIGSTPVVFSAVYAGGSYTNNLAGTLAISNNTPERIDCTGGKELSLEIKFQSKANSTTDDVIVGLGRNLSGSRTITDIKGFQQWGTAQCGANSTVTVNNTNITVSGYPYIYILYLSNSAAGAGGITNYSIRYHVK